VAVLHKRLKVKRICLQLGKVLKCSKRNPGTSKMTFGKQWLPYCLLRGAGRMLRQRWGRWFPSLGLTLELARRGFQVTGVDRTRPYLDSASRQAETEGLEIEFVQSDMRDFCRPDAFDAVVNLFTSFGYFEDPEDDRQVALNVYRSLKPGGVFLIDMMGKEVLARIFSERDWYEEDGVLILQERKITKNWSWMENRWIIFVDNNRAELNLSHRIYSAVELTSLLTECGFAPIDAYGNLDGSAYDHLARRLVVVAHK
jgi:SAM-dependent methyltransferase